MCMSAHFSSQSLTPSTSHLAGVLLKTQGHAVECEPLKSASDALLCTDTLLLPEVHTVSCGGPLLTAELHAGYMLLSNTVVYLVQSGQH